MADETKQNPGMNSTNTKNSTEGKPDFTSYLLGINQEFKEEELKEKAKQMGIGYVHIAEVNINADCLQFITKEEAESGKMIVYFQSGKKIHVAVTDPRNKITASVILLLQQKGLDCSVYLASEEGIKLAQQLYYSSMYKEKIDKRTTISEETGTNTDEDIKKLFENSKGILEKPTEEILRLLQAGAIKTNTSDIHIQPEENFVRIRFRIDGILRDILEIPLEIYDQIVKNIKYQSHLKLNINALPQDGQYNFIINERKVDVRVSTLPTYYGETVVLRFLDPKRGFLSLEELGFSENPLKLVQKALQRANGLILVTGPTGSGKTTTLYSMLNILNTSSRKIITLEDPIEYHLKGVSQSQVNNNEDYSFSSGLRAILRQDPDVIMIGEIRDLNTAETAAQASLTGHIVLSTLHTNSAVETIPRLIDMGLPPFIIAPSLNIVIAQRLVRKVCECALEKIPQKTEKIQLENIIADMEARNISLPPLKTIKSPTGCDTCSNTGYKGQTTLMEVMFIDDDIKELILNKSHSRDLLIENKKKGMITIREDGIMKVLKGETTLSEVWRVS